MRNLLLANRGRSQVVRVGRFLFHMGYLIWYGRRVSQIRDNHAENVSHFGY